MINSPSKARPELTKWLAPLAIFALCLGFSLLYSSRFFQLVSDAGREYEVYLQYISAGWHPITGNILSSSLFTTALPALIQSVLKLPDPETVYRITLAALVALLPALVYIFARRFSSAWVSAALSQIFFSTFYYQGYAMYARMHVGITFALLLLMAMTSSWKSKYIWMGFSAIGIIISHYTVAYIYAGLLLAAGIVFTAYYLTTHKKPRFFAPVVISAVVLLALSLFWYSLVIPATAVYATYGIKGVAGDIISPPSLNIFAGLTSDFVKGKLYLLIRLALEMAVVIWLICKKKMSLIPLLWLFAISIGFISMWSPAIQLYIGAFRPSFILLPVEIMGIAWWWGGRKQWLIWIPLFAWSWFYH